ncbi:MAG: glycosyltransferase family 4 protein [Granulosicoccus sp.]|nr:glycosyltransferase family 4 protein [Granulosicoccus sp.]
MSVDPAPLAIVVKCWPRLSETFVAQELAALEARGQRFEIWSLRHPTSGKQHPLHRQVQAKINYLPEYLHQEFFRVLRCWWAVRSAPGFRRAHRVWWQDVRRDLSRNRIRRFGQACVLAAEMPDSTRGLYAHFLHTPSSVARYAAIMQGLPWSFSAHAKDIWTSPDWELREKMNPKSDGAVFGVSCTASGVAYLNSLADSSDLVDLVYHGLDLSRFPEPPVRDADKDRSVFQLLSVGRLVEKKGFDRLIDAFALLPDSLRWHWVHIGGGDLKDMLQDRARQAGVSERISWMGEREQPEVIQAMRAADVFILPSRVAVDGDRDGLPNVLMEAASQKLAIISTAVSAIPEFIESGKHGLLTDDVPASLATAITSLANDESTRTAFANAAYHRLASEFGVSAGIEKLERHLIALCNTDSR